MGDKFSWCSDSEFVLLGETMEVLAAAASPNKRMKVEGSVTRGRTASPSQGIPSLASSWILDKDRSETLMPYLRLMGLSEMAIEAWTKAEKETDTFKVIEFVMNPKAVRTGVRILKRDRVQDATEVSKKTVCGRLTHLF